MNRTYQNPIARNGDFADPFVIKYNGKYYLYGTNPDVRCWSSDNLLDWKLEGPTIEADTFPDLVPFAPEVTYANGKFYMYTSPSGFGHFVLESDKPTGPFRKISDNVAHAIDGSIFIDDDGTWYFYWAADEGIWGCKMISPTEFGEPVFTGVTMYGWTEGPFIVKQNGVYYMTYTGNHYLSKGYRINCAWSNHPLEGYQDEKYNPVIIHTRGEVVGLGHSSTVLGPDLVSSYIIYHNMNEDASRDLDIDRQLWYEQATQILGPTRTKQAAPNMAEHVITSQRNNTLILNEEDNTIVHEGDLYYIQGNHTFLLSEERLYGNFTAEFNLVIPKDNLPGDKGILFGAKEDYYYLVFQEEEKQVQLWNITSSNRILVLENKLPNYYLFDVLHSIRVEGKNNEYLRIFIDSRLQMEINHLGWSEIGIGYGVQEGRIGFGYTAFTGKIVEEARKEVVIPMNTFCYGVFGGGTGSELVDGSALLEKGDFASYDFLVDRDGEQVIFIHGNTRMDCSKLTLSMDGSCIEESNALNGIWSSNIQLNQGVHTLEIHCKEGNAFVERLGIFTVDDKIEEGLIQTPITIGPFGKKLFGKELMTDYSVSVKGSITQMGDESNAGILLRVTEPAEGGEGADTQLGIHFFIGYSISFNGTELTLAKHRYDKKVLKSCPYSMRENQAFDLKVEIKDIEIKIYVDKEDTPRLIVQDMEPIIYGCAGIWTQNSLLTIDEINVNM